MLLHLSSHRRKYEVRIQPPCLQVFTLDPVQPPLPLQTSEQNDESSLQPVSTICIPPCLRRKPPCSHHCFYFGASKSKALSSPHPPRHSGQKSGATFDSFLPPLCPSIQTISTSCLLCFRHYSKSCHFFPLLHNHHLGSCQSFPTGLPAATLNPFSPEKPETFFEEINQNLITPC